MKQFIYIFIFLIAGWQCSMAQDVSRFKILDDFAYQSSNEYLSGNKYQKDAILFMDMVADTHPYYIKAGRRAEWFAKKDSLLKQCASILSDEDFVDALIALLGPLHDKHTDLTTEQRLQERKNTGKEEPEAAESSAAGIDCIMCQHDALYDYTIFPDMSICYLQFNQCVDIPESPFEAFLDSMFAEMDARNIKTLVVDVQYNSGGSSRLCDALLQHLYPIGKLENYTTYLRFSDLMAAYNRKIAAVKARWEDEGHKDELYEVPSPKIPADYQQPPIYEGNVIFVMGPKTYSSAGILLTLARDNHIGTIIGTTSTFSPSHYGEVLPYRLPNTDVLGSISCKFFARPDAANVDAASLEPDCVINLDDKELAWEYIIKNYGN